MKISVIMPVYNASRFLAASLGSIVAAARQLQATESGASVEFIGVDDGSADSSGALLDAWAERVRKTDSAAIAVRIVHRPNAGASAARNCGMDLATGELVTFLDADDTYDPQALAIIASVWRQSGAEVLRYGCNTVRSHRRDVLLRRRPTWSELDLNDSTETPLKRCGLGWATVLAAPLAKSVRWPLLTHGEDPLFALEALANSRKSVRIAGNLANYLVRRDSASHTVSMAMVTATCEYLKSAYDGCAAMAGFPKFRLDTCRHLAQFLTGPLAEDVPPAEVPAARAALAAVREEMIRRDPLFAVLTVREHYDLVFSLGSACSCSATLRTAKLQHASFPFDWLIGPHPEDRARLLAEDFAGWLEKPGDFHEIPSPEGFRHASWVNDRTGFVFYHDFDQGVELAAQLPSVREKYARRIRRLQTLLKESRRVLVTWIGDPRDDFRLTESELQSCLTILRRRYPAVDFKFLVFECVPDIPATNPEVGVAADLTRIAFDYRLPEAGREWCICMERLLPYLAGYTVRDYRTPELRRAHARAERQRDREKFPAKTFLGYLALKLEFKVFRHLKKHLQRHGVRTD